MNLGLLAVAMGEYPGAEQAYRTALRLDAVFVPGYVNLADLLRRQGRDGEGESLLDAGIQAVGEHADLSHAMGLVLVRQQRLKDALPYLRKASMLAPDRPSYNFV